MEARVLACSGSSANGSLSLQLCCGLLTLFRLRGPERASEPVQAGTRPDTMYRGGLVSSPLAETQIYSDRYVRAFV